MSLSDPVGSHKLESIRRAARDAVDALQYEPDSSEVARALRVFEDEAGPDVVLRLVNELMRLRGER